MTDVEKFKITPSEERLDPSDWKIEHSGGYSWFDEENIYYVEDARNPQKAKVIPRESD